MTSPGGQPRRLNRLIALIPSIASIAVGACGVLVLLGWLLDVEVLKSLLHPGRIAMNPATATCFILTAAALSWQLSRRARVLAAIVILIGVARLAGYLFGWHSGPDQVLFRAKLAGNVMAPNTAVAFVLVGLGLALIAHSVSQIFFLAAGCIAVLSLTGYLFNIGALYGMSGYIPMALNTSACFGLMVLGALCSRPQREPIATLLDDTVGGRVARRLLPAAFLLPLLLGYLRLLGERRGWFSAAFGLSLLVLGLIVIFNLLIWWTAQVLRRIDLRRRGAEAALVQTEKLAALGQMVAGVAHEINNPLAFVSNNIAVLQRDVRAIAELLKLYMQADRAIAERNASLLAEIRDLSDRIDLVYTMSNLDDLLVRSRDGLKRIQQIVKDLRDFARLDAADLHDADINAGIESTVNIVQGLAKKKQVKIDLQLRPLPPLACYAAKINQVVMNLLTNAIDACSADGRVIVRTASGAGAVVIEVADDGKGIPPEIRQRIFDPFFTTKKIGEGTGLGLSISYGIVKDHGGSIAVDSEPGRGSTFRVTLPARGVRASP